MTSIKLEAMMLALPSAPGVFCPMHTTELARAVERSWRMTKVESRTNDDDLERDWCCHEWEGSKCKERRVWLTSKRRRLLSKGKRDLEGDRTVVGPEASILLNEALQNSRMASTISRARFAVKSF